ETVLSMVTHVHDAANGLDHRKRQVEQAEERLARAEAMLSEVQTGLERLHGQKALVDQAVTQASALEFHTKQAETVIAALSMTRKEGTSPRRIGYAPPAGGHSMSGWEDRGIPASACAGGRSGCEATTIRVLARTSLPSVRALTFLGVCGPPK